MKVDAMMNDLVGFQFMNKVQKENFRSAARKFEQYWKHRRIARAPLNEEQAEKKYNEAFLATQIGPKRRKNIDALLQDSSLKAVVGPAEQLEEISESKTVNALAQHSKKVFNEMREMEETHKAIIYDIVISKVWAKTGMMKSYAATYKILNELKNCGMEPRTMLDFGCGAGPSLWAANELFKESLEEYTGVDKSLDQLRMARYVVTGGHPDRDTPGIRFKKSLPDGIAGSKEQYNIGT